jgi:hypothetical protein
MPDEKLIEIFGRHFLDLNVLDFRRWRTLPHPVDQADYGRFLAFQMRLD